MAAETPHFPLNHAARHCSEIADSCAAIVRLLVSANMARTHTSLRAAVPLAPPLKWHGGKHHLARKIVALMPPHTHYVEPYAGGHAVLLAKPCDGISEVVNDLNGQLTNFWTVLQDRRLFPSFQRLVAAIPFSEVE